MKGNAKTFTFVFIAMLAIAMTLQFRASATHAQGRGTIVAAFEFLSYRQFAFTDTGEIYLSENNGLDWSYLVTAPGTISTAHLHGFDAGYVYMTNGDVYQLNYPSPELSYIGNVFGGVPSGTSTGVRLRAPTRGTNDERESQNVHVRVSWDSSVVACVSTWGLDDSSWSESKRMGTDSVY